MQGALNTAVSNEKKLRIPRIAGLKMMPLQIATKRHARSLVSCPLVYCIGRAKTGVSETSGCIKHLSVCCKPAVTFSR